MSQRFNFYDITIYQKVGEAYLNLTDFSFQRESEMIQIASESEYLIMYENYLNHVRMKKKEPVRYSEITYEQLQIIAGFASNEKKKRKSKTAINNSKYFGLLCAETIMNTGYTKRVLVSEDAAEFQQRKLNEEGKKVMTTIVSLDVKSALLVKEER